MFFIYTKRKGDIMKIKSLITKFKNRPRKWKLYLYLNGQCIKCLKISQDFAPMNQIYVVKVKGMKHLMGTNKSVQIVVRSFKYKYTEEKKRKAHIEVILYEGSDIE